MRAAETPEGAEITAFNALAFLAGEPDRLERFLAASGADSGILRDIAGNHDLMVAILDFLLSDEGLLLKFCDTTGTKPRAIHQARYVLGGE
jgi:hypothetical protein